MVQTLYGVLLQWDGGTIPFFEERLGTNLMHRTTNLPLIALFILAILIAPCNSLAVTPKTQKLIDQYQAATDTKKERLAAKLEKTADRLLEKVDRERTASPERNRLTNERYEDATAIYKAVYGETSKEVAKAHEVVANYFLARDLNATARSHLLEAEQIYKKIYGENDVSVGKVYVFLGEAYEHDVLARAEGYYLDARKIFENAYEDENNDDFVNLYFHLGKLYVIHGYVQKAREPLTHAIEIRSSLGKSTKYIRYYLAQNYKSSGDYVNASNILGQIKNYGAAVYAHLLDIYIEQEKFSYVERVLRDLSNQSSISQYFLSGNAKYLSAKGNYLQAVAWHQWLISGEKQKNFKNFRWPGLLNSLSDHEPTVTRAILNLADDVILAGDYYYAERLLNLALAQEESRLQTDQLKFVDVQMRIALLHKHFGDYRRAREFFQLALDNFEKLGQGYNGKQQFFHVEKNVAELYVATGEYDKALAHFENALAGAIERVGPSNPSLLGYLYSLADYYSILGEVDRSNYYLDEAASITSTFFDSRHTWHAIILHLRGTNAMHIGDYGIAISNMEEALSILKRKLLKTHIAFSTLYRDLGDAYLKSGDRKSGEKNLLAALEHMTKRFPEGSPQKLQVLTNLIELYSDDAKGETAETYIGEALQLSARFDHPEIDWRVQWTVSKYLAQDDDRNAAIMLGKQAVATIQNLRSNLLPLHADLQKSFISNRKAPYRDLANWMIDEGRLTEAKQVLGLLKQEEYLDFIRRSPDYENDTIGFNTTEDHWRDELQRISAQVVVRSKKLRELESRRQQEKLKGDEEKAYQALLAEQRATRVAFQQYLADIRRDFYQQGERRAEDLGRKQLETLPALQGLLARHDDEATLVHYLVTQDKVRILVTTPLTQFHRDSSIDVTELNRLVFAFREGLLDLEQPAAQFALYDLLIAPIEGDLQQAETSRLIVSLDGVLRYIPFAALHDGEHFLIEKYALSIFTAAARLTFDERGQGTMKIAGFGVSEGTADFSPLPAVPRELNSIILSGDDDKEGVAPGVIYLDKAFSAAALADVLNAPDSDSYPVVHIASHFVFNPGSETDTFLLLGNEQRLTLEEIRFGNYPLRNVDMLTLSACETALGGAGQDGSEIEGFASLAQNLGAKSVVATLWSVTDASTGILMREFYRIRNDQGLKKADALRQAQLALMNSENQRYAHPFYWAPFILMGNWL